MFFRGCANPPFAATDPFPPMATFLFSPAPDMTRFNTRVHALPPLTFIVRESDMDCLEGSEAFFSREPQLMAQKLETSMKSPSSIIRSDTLKTEGICGVALDPWHEWTPFLSEGHPLDSCRKSRRVMPEHRVARKGSLLANLSPIRTEARNFPPSSHTRLFAIDMGCARAFRRMVPPLASFPPPFTWQDFHTGEDFSFGTVVLLRETLEVTLASGPSVNLPLREYCSVRVDTPFQDLA